MSWPSAAIDPKYFREVAEVLNAATGGPPNRAKVAVSGLLPTCDRLGRIGMACMAMGWWRHGGEAHALL